MSDHGSLAWRCRRGTRELDLVLQSFLNQAYDTASATEQASFQALLDLPDPELHRVLFDLQPADGPELNRLVAKIRAHFSV